MILSEVLKTLRQYFKAILLTLFSKVYFLLAVDIDGNFLEVIFCACIVVEDWVDIDVVLAWQDQIILYFRYISVNVHVIPTVITADESTVLSNHHGLKVARCVFFFRRGVLPPLIGIAITLLCTLNNECLFIQIDGALDNETEELIGFFVKVTKCSVVYVPILISD